MDRFDAMQAFARVVEAGSFTKAADTLQVSKATVTQLVRQLETRLRVKLLNRTTRQVRVTADGAAYYEHVLQLLADMEEAEAALSSGRLQPRGRLRVDVPSPIAQTVLIPALPAFHARYPEIQIDMGVSDRVVDVIGDSVDCVVRGGEPTTPSLVARRLADLPIGAYAAPGYLQQHGVPTHPSALESTHHRAIGFLWQRIGRPLPFEMQRGDERVAVHARYTLAVDDGNACLAAGLAGLGIVWLPRYMVDAHTARGALVELFEDWRFDPIPLYVLYPPNRHVNARVRAFVDWVVELTAPMSTPARSG
jgi:DNA-binding transcriptional LysR family regulator